MSGIVSLTDYDIEPILALLPDLEHDWQDEAIFIRRCPGSRPRDLLHQIASVATRHHTGPLAIAVEQTCAHVGGRPARALLVRLKPGATEAYTDGGIYGTAVTRLYLPLVTNPDAWIETDGIRYHLAAGTVYAFDKDVPHCGGNGGAEPMIYMLIDAHPDSAEILAG